MLNHLEFCLAPTVVSRVLFACARAAIAVALLKRLSDHFVHWGSLMHPCESAAATATAATAVGTELCGVAYFVVYLFNIFPRLSRLILNGPCKILFVQFWNVVEYDCA